MNILILGAGQVGCSVAEHLVSPENHVTIVDNDEQKLTKISDKLDVCPILGHAAHPSVLEMAGAQNADILIALTNRDEINIVACSIVHTLFNIPIKIARIRDQNFLNKKQKPLLFSDKNNTAIDYIISPEVEIAKTISKGLLIGGLVNVVDIFDDAKLINVRCLESSQVINTPVKILSNLFPTIDMSIIAIQRNGETFIPNNQDIIQQNDSVYIIVAQNNVVDVISAFGHLEQHRKNVTIAGCGNIGSVLAEEIEKNQPDVNLKIVEKNADRLAAVSSILKKAEFFAEDACNLEILQEAVLNDCDTFISVTNDDKANIISALLAKYCNVRHVTALLSDQKLVAFASSLGIDTLIDPSAVTVSTILGCTKQNLIKSIYSIGGRVEVLEIDVDDVSNIVGLSTTDDVMIPGQVLVAALKRDNDLYLLPSNYTITAGDKLIMIVTIETVYKIEKIILGRSSYV
jgi:trk system potassium uptake protein TrkA